MKDIELGTLIKQKRKDKGLTLRALSEETGVSHSYISQLENGRNRNPSPLFLKRLSDALEIPYTLLASKIEDKYILNEQDTASLLNLEGKAEEAIEILNLMWANVGEEYKLVLINEDDSNPDDLADYIQNENNHLTYKGHRLTQENREQILRMLEVLFPQNQK